MNVPKTVNWMCLEDSEVCQEQGLTPQCRDLHWQVEKAGSNSKPVGAEAADFFFSLIEKLLLLDN